MKYSIFLALLVAAISTANAAESPEEKGYRIALEAVEAGRGFGSAEGRGEMILSDKSGDTSVRAFRARVLETGPDANSSMIIFEAPKDIAGTALLTLSDDRGDNQWIYFPSTKRVKRISTSSKTTAFAGSEFTYEDLTGAPIDRYRYKWLGDEPCPNKVDQSCNILERTPHFNDSGYSRQIIWMEKDDFLIYKIDFYNLQGQLIKSLSTPSYKRYKDKYWRATESTMSNRQTGKKTVMRWGDIDFNANFTKNDFTQRALERVH